jgi:hypothetical protein
MVMFVDYIRMSLPDDADPDHGAGHGHDTARDGRGLIVLSCTMLVKTASRQLVHYFTMP